MGLSSALGVSRPCPFPCPLLLLLRLLLLLACMVHFHILALQCHVLCFPCASTLAPHVDDGIVLRSY